MDERAESAHGAGRAVHNPTRAGRSPSLDDGSEAGESSTKYRRIDQEGARASTASEQASRFLFVDSSSSGQRPRSDQRAINAHIQQTAHRNRKQAGRKQKTTGTANIGRQRPRPVLQPRPVEALRIADASAALQQRGSPETPSVPSVASSPASSSTVSVRADSRTPEPQTPGLQRAPPTAKQEQLDREQLDRLRHYSNVRRNEVQEAVNAQRSEQNASTDVARRASFGDETSSVRSMLTQILQRLDAGHPGTALQSPPNSSLRNTVLDPFNISSVHITPSMNTALRHCKSFLPQASVFYAVARYTVEPRALAEVENPEIRRLKLTWLDLFLQQTKSTKCRAKK
ncbi:hypothetical protein A1O7_09944 [Cladophialophora yegresii CBS 114405]|uniref:Uncharacterized protein n=1 Tax=Cladophialophora yegresii CBS 114405 TaxID=1182544 RepID=W9VGJ4_9EURO|nr:uncharacterized protein A1O7_09944 [Cladophialophora yegresii CBS 114405]EXJ54603.1 hypothetical protein A1O7_09944 [Cladophialophora yegresii CBS 114405]